MVHYTRKLCSKISFSLLLFPIDFLSFQTFTEGLTNQLIGCYVGSLQGPGSVLVRLYGRRTELYVNRDEEVEMFQVFHAHGCGPQIYCTFQNGICYEFVSGKVLEDELLRQPSIYRSLATLISVKPCVCALFGVTFPQFMLVTKGSKI